jgi:hypothetical protein
LVKGLKDPVYIKSETSVVKIFHQRRGWHENFKELERFLILYQYTKSVPKLLRIDFENAIIEMEYLKDYVTLWDAKRLKLIKTRKIAESLIDMVQDTHLRMIPDDQHSYQDLGFFDFCVHQTNTMVKFGSEGLCVDAKFIEGGKFITAPNIVKNGIISMAMRDYCGRIKG